MSKNRQVAMPASFTPSPIIGLLVMAFALLFAAGTLFAQNDRPEKFDTMAMVAVSQVNINTASADQLAAALSGIGEAKAAEIVAYRTEHGAFGSVEELLNINGIGRKTLERNRAQLVAQ